MNTVKMLDTVFASEDGIHPKHYMKGKVYQVSDFLLRAFVEMGAVRLYDYEQDPDTFATKDIVPARRGRPKKT